MQSFYQGKTNARKLVWLYGLGSCVVKGNFDAKPVDVQCPSVFHAAVLLQFNTGEP